MPKKVKIQDIADELGVSRNTVSKALNNTGYLAESTRNRIIEKAVEMGYKQFAYLSLNEEFDAHVPGDIALFSCNMPSSLPFASELLSGFEQELSKNGCRLSIHIIRPEEMEQLRLPNNFNADNIDGILCIEMFHNQYTDMICSLGKPVLLVDSFVRQFDTRLNADLLYMESYQNIYRLTSQLIESGVTKIGFAGDHMHCQSFHDRFRGYRDAMLAHELHDYKSYCILEEDNSPYYDPQWLWGKIDHEHHMPEALICANDYIAIDVIKVLKSYNVQIPKDVMICGFDGSEQAEIIEPALTTVKIPNLDMGIAAADIMMSRIRRPDLPYRTTYIRTDICYRESTRKFL